MSPLQSYLIYSFNEKKTIECREGRYTSNPFPKGESLDD